MTTPPLLTSPRLVLRPWCDADAPALYPLASDPEVGPRAGWPPHTSEQESLHIIRTVFANPTTWAVTLRADGTLIGAIGYGPSCDCSLPALPGEPTVGYWIGRAYWRQGYCTEALNELLRYCRTVIKPNAIWGDHFIDNPASGRVMEKCGFSDIGELCQSSKLYNSEGRPLRILRYIR